MSVTISSFSLKTNAIEIGWVGTTSGDSKPSTVRIQRQQEEVLTEPMCSTSFLFQPFVVMNLGRKKKRKKKKPQRKKRMILRECWVRKIELKELKERSRRTRF